MGKFNFFKNKTLIIIVVILLVVSGTGMTAAYWKLALNPQNPNNVPPTSNDLPGYGSDEERDFGIRKEFIGRPPGARMNGEIMVAPKDSTINYQIDFKGKLDRNPGIAKADVMFLIDRSMSMKSKVPRGDLPDDCYFYPDNGAYGNSKLCWSIEAIQSFLRLTAEERREVKVGYVTYAADRYTTDQENPQNFKPLADMWGPNNQRDETKNQWLKKINFVSSDEVDAVGTAMGKAANYALEELQEHGREGVQKYIIVVTDGIGNLNPLMTGCASWRKTPSDAWPTSQVCRTCPWGKGLRGDPKTCKNPPPPDPSQPPSDLNFLSPYITSIHSADLVDCCIAYDPNAVAREGYPPDFEEIEITPFNNSPVGKAVTRDIKMPMIGFGIADSKAKIGQGNLNDALLRNIAQHTYKEPGAGEKWAFIVKTPKEIQDGLRAIFQEFSDKAATIHFEETLPAGVDVSGITIERNVKNMNVCSETTNYYCRKLYTTNPGGGNNDNNIKVSKDDSSGRMVIKFDLVESHYSGDGDYGGTIPFENRRFFVALTVKTANAANSAFDLDQNQDTTCGGNLPNAPDNNPVSWAEWRWYSWPSEPLRNPIKTKTPKLCVRLRPTQYTGDVYGTGINKYNFPYIDALVAGASIVPGSQAVWELPNYKFSESKTSFSNFNNYQNYLGNQIKSLKNKAETKGNISDALLSGFNEKVYPEGKIFYVPRGQGQTLSSLTQIKGRRTVIVDDDLTINAEIVKKNERSTAAIIVLGNVTINDAKSIQAGIIAPGFGPNWGWINIESSNKYLDILGFLIGDHVRLKSQASSDTQSILYDPDLIKFPPPGLTNLSLPLYQEVAP